jgi:hypothetical protein
MYWNNPLIELTWPSNADPIAGSTNNGTHCLFFDPAYNFRTIEYKQTLNDLCNWAQERLVDGHDQCFGDEQNWYDLANLVKLNMWIHSIREHGIVKPWLLLDDNGITCGTGESRLRCLERIPDIATAPAFISTHQSRAHLYNHLKRVETFDQFAALCNATPGQQFLFRPTDAQAPFGLYWYEYNSDLTRAVTPSQDECLTMLRNYLELHPEIEITPEWFDSIINWDQYRTNV